MSSAAGERAGFGLLAFFNLEGTMTEVAIRYVVFLTPTIPVRVSRQSALALAEALHALLGGEASEAADRALVRIEAALSSTRDSPRVQLTRAEQRALLTALDRLRRTDPQPPDLRRLRANLATTVRAG